MGKEQLTHTSNLMTKTTEQRLRKEYQEQEKKVADIGKQLGDAAGTSNDWHDNFAYEQAVRDYQLEQTRLELLRSSLIDIEIINPREETENINLGNQIILQFEDEPEKENFTLLGTFDSGTADSWLSYKSPLGKSLMNKKRGEIVEYEVEKRKYKAKVIDILPGEFE